MADVWQLLIAENIAATTVTENHYRFTLYLVVIFKAEPDPDFGQQTADKLEIGFLPLDNHFAAGVVVA